METIRVRACSVTIRRSSLFGQNVVLCFAIVKRDSSGKSHVIKALNLFNPDGVNERWGGGVSQRGTGNTIIRFNSGGREMEKWSVGERPRRSVWRNRLVEAAETQQAGSEAIS